MAIARTFTFFLLVLSHLLSATPIKPDATILIPMRDGVELPADIYLPTP